MFAIMLQSSFLLAASVASVLGAPVNEVDFADPSLGSLKTRELDGKPDDTFKYEEICGHDLSKEDAKNVWKETGPSLYIDLFVNSSDPDRGYDDWVKKLDKSTWGKEQSDAWDCTSFPGQCGPAADCKEFFTLRERPLDYWIFKAIDGAHKVMARLHEALQDSAIRTSFELDTIISDFKGNAKDLTDVYGKMAAGFTIGAGAVSLIPGPGKYAAGAFTSIAGVFSMAALDASPDPKSSVEEYLSYYFTQSQAVLEETARNLFGGNGGDQKKLPNLSNPYHYMNEVTQFFDDGRFLIEDVDEATNKTIDTAKTNLRQAIGMSVLESQGWTLFIDPGIPDEARCKQDGGSHIWRDEYKECWGLLKWAKVPSGDPFSADTLEVTQLPEDIVQKMKDYKMDLKKVYDNAVACSLAHPDSAKIIKIKELRPDGDKLPECFFSIGVRKGTFHANEFVEQDLWGNW